MIPDDVQEHLRPRSAEETQQLGQEARRWLESDTLNTALALMRKAAHEKWYASKDPAIREACWVELHRIDDFVQALHQLVNAEKLVTAKVMRHADRHRVPA